MTVETISERNNIFRIRYDENIDLVEMTINLNKMKKKYDSMTIERFNKSKEDLSRKIKKMEKEINDIVNNGIATSDHKIVID